MVALLLLIALVVGAVWLFYFSTALAVKDVEVHGTRTLASEEIREVAAVPSGQPLARVDLDAIRARVEALAVVRDAEVTRTWPDRVLIDVEERVAIAVVEIGGRTRGMDAEGVVFSNYPKPPPGMPQVRMSTETRSDALQEAALVVESLPDEISRRVDHVEVATIDQISLVLRDGKTVMWGSAEESEREGRGPGRAAPAAGPHVRRQRAGTAHHLRLIRSPGLRSSVITACHAGSWCDGLPTVLPNARLT